MAKNTENTSIPFVKPARIGNFKIWRSKKIVGNAKAKAKIEQISVSTIDGSWQVTIPETFEMFSMISDMYEEHTEERMGQISFILSNMLYASCISNGFFQRAITICATIYANPTMLKEDDPSNAKLMKDVHNLIDGFLDWRKAYDEKVSGYEPTEQEIENEDRAEKMAKILTDDGDGTES